MITIKYDGNLVKVTGKRKETGVVNENLPFIMILHFIFESYPQIEKKYPPGRLKLKLNGKRPREMDFLKDKDIVTLEDI